MSLNKEASVRDAYCHSGKILLKRQEASFVAAFGLVRSDLPWLEEQLLELHEQERARYAGLKFARRRHNYLLGRVAARSAVAALMENADPVNFHIGSGIFGFPVVKGLSGIQVSISHCGCTGIALAFPEEHPLGVDIEAITEERFELVQGLLSASEKILTGSCGLLPAAAGTLAWTAKEGLSKILRTGLTADTNIMELGSLVKTDSFYESTFKNFDQYKAFSICTQSHAGTIVLPRKTTFDPKPLLTLVANVISV